MLENWRLYAPGARKRNKFWVARGRHPETGKTVEISTGQATKPQAKAWLRVWYKNPTPSQAAVAAPAPVALETPVVPVAAQPAGPARCTYGEAIAAYARIQLNIDDLDAPPRHYGEVRSGDVRRLRRLRDGDPALKIPGLGDRPVETITVDDLKTLANKFPSLKTPTAKDRAILVPGRAVLNYAAENGWCAKQKMRGFGGDKPRHRTVSLADARRLIDAAPEGKKRLLVLFLCRHGMRISELLGAEWGGPAGDRGIDLEAGTLRLYRGKDDAVMLYWLVDEVKAALAAIPVAERVGRLFPWRERHGVYAWLNPLSKQLGIKFTPHMARHTVGTYVANEKGVLHAKTVLGHADIRSTMRYVRPDWEVARAALNELGDAMTEAGRKASRKVAA